MHSQVHLKSIPMLSDGKLKEAVMDDIDYLKSKIILSPNEARCVKLNKILRRNLNTVNNSLAKEYRNKTQEIKCTIESINEIKTKLPVTTGFAFDKCEESVLACASDKSIDQKSNRYIRNFNGVQSAMAYRSPEERVLRAKAAMSRSKSNLEYSKPQRHEILEEPEYLETLNKFIDKSNRSRLSDVKHEKPVLNRISSAYASFKDKDLVEWNKFASIEIAKNKFKKNEINYELKDEDRHRVYQKLCETRDSIIKLPKSKIDENKKLDPVFNKRYRQFVFAKSCNRVPEFDRKDNFIRPFNQKLLIQREMESIIDMKKTRNAKTNYFQSEFLKSIEKVKQFSQQFEIF